MIFENTRQFVEQLILFRYLLQTCIQEKNKEKKLFKLFIRHYDNPYRNYQSHAINTNSSLYIGSIKILTKLELGRQIEIAR